ncbi:MAG TPA: putative glycoside hydrolase [Polyangiaceae bacterium]|nr:putative glycoside hydrolase [Polyangiaceae bacterium]
MQVVRALALCAGFTLCSAVAHADEPRLGWPEDKQISGVYAHIGMLNQPSFPGFLDRIAKNGMNAVVIDGKDYQGWVTYPSAVPLVADTKAAHVLIKDLEAMVHEAHARDVRVIMRIACFHDQWTSQRRPDLAIKGMSEWLDPNNTDAQDYLIALVEETLAAGVDEIQLDYVRYPTEKINNAKFGLAGKSTMDVITGFVSRVHEKTQAAGVPLALDVFGVVAWQRAVDVRATGQDLSRLGKIVEVLCPMIYPSHFQVGFNGYQEPGDHPDVVLYGTKQAVSVLKRIGSTTVVRPWIQAFPWHSHNYSSTYVLQEIEDARIGGGVGWLGWNAGGYYGEVFAASWQKHAQDSKTAGH